MHPTSDVDNKLRSFLTTSRFTEAGAVITDLDGTAVHELDGRVMIPQLVSHGLRAIHNRSHRPVVLNTLRFPLNVIQTFGREWHAITSAPLPLVSLNGSITGYLSETRSGEIVFEEMDAFVLSQNEIEEVLTGIEGLTANGVTDLLVFYYARDWTLGEVIWTPSAQRVQHVREKYRSASAVLTGDTAGLRGSLLGQDICMILLLVEVPEDERMAYQQGASPTRFVTRAGVDKLSGAKAVADRLGFDLAHSVGAGDTPMDTFLSGCGLAVHVGPLDLEYKGQIETIRIGNSHDLGKLLYQLADFRDLIADSLP
jgi:hydroxymethylpyrimidine pyrophosphatase-like HAD family hydrolase